MPNRPVATLALTIALASAYGISRGQEPLRAASSARDMYNAALAKERSVRAPEDGQNATPEELRMVIAAYERLVRRYPGSGYADNALWQAAGLALDLFERFGEEAGRDRARTLLATLIEQYPASSLAARAAVRLRDLSPPPAPESDIGRIEPAPDTRALPDIRATAGAGPTSPPLATLRSIQQASLGEGVRVTIELDAEVSFQSERLESPQRVFFDLAGTQAARNAIEPNAADDLVKRIRLGRRPNNTTRVVLDLDKVGRHSVFALYNPFRVVVDFERAEAKTVTTVPPVLPTVSRAEATPVAAESLKADAAAPPVAVTPKAPVSNSVGGFSLARQLGLGISRIVIDAGHGGHDPGAQANRVAEAELVLDIALRVERLLSKQPGVEVIMTRRTDVFIPLEERTAIANRDGADLFLSIHANASTNARARGIETYFLNFASNPEAEAVAARENATSGRSMHNLPDILKAIALNTKVDESRDLATTIQKSMVTRLRTQNKQLRDLGVKQAPFVVLIGAAMPSVLAEISFVTNRGENALLRTSGYRQRIAEALTDGVLRYQRALKSVGSVAQQ